MSELKSCPFCGKEPCWNMGNHVVICPDDDCPAGFVFVEPSAWNTRATSDAKALVEELVELIRPRNLSDGLPFYNADKIDIAVTKATAWLSNNPVKE